MKKLFTLFVAIVMVLSFSACGSSKPRNIPVKFGNVTDVEILGSDSDAIVLSMDEPSSSDGAERDVYIAAVDYIFTYAPTTLSELSVTAYDPNGDFITAFTMPSYLVESLREVEAQGSWGTEGFCAFFYFNHDAYDVLVQSCIPSGNP